MEYLKVKEGQSVSHNIENVKVRFKYFRSLYYMRKRDNAIKDIYNIKDMHLDRLGYRLYSWGVCHMDTLEDLVRDCNNVGIATNTMATFNKLRYISPKRGDIYDVVADAIHDINDIQDVLIHRGFRLI